MAYLVNENAGRFAMLHESHLCNLLKAFNYATQQLVFFCNCVYQNLMDEYDL
jgi:hypothetical protein